MIILVRIAITFAIFFHYKCFRANSSFLSPRYANEFPFFQERGLNREAREANAKIAKRNSTPSRGLPGTIPFSARSRKNLSAPSVLRFFALEAGSPASQSPKYLIFSR